MHFSKLHTKVVLLVVGLLTIAIIYSTSTTLLARTKSLRSDLRSNCIATAETAALASSSLILADDKQSMRTLAAMLVHNQAALGYIIITDDDGEVIGDSRPEQSEMGLKIRDLATPPAATVVLEIVDPFHSDSLQITVPVSVSGAPWGSLRVVAPLAPLYSAQLAEVRRIAVLGFVLLIIGIAAALALARSISKPVERLAVVAREIAKGNLHIRTELSRGDELGHLARAIDGMILDLEFARAEREQYSATLEAEVSRRTREIEEQAIVLSGREALLHAMANATTLGFLVADSVSGRILYINNHFRSMFQIADDGQAPVADSKHYTELMAECSEKLADPAEFLRSIKRLHDDHNASTVEYELKCKNGADFRMFSAEVPADDGTHIGRLYLFEDITVRKQTEQMLAAARDQALEVSRMKSEFLANMSHEIRTPMNGVLGLAEVVLGGELDADQRRLMETVKSSGETLLTLINDILDLSKIESGKLELESIPFSMRDVIQQSVALVENRAHAKSLSLNYEIGEAVPARVVGDPTRLRQILLNLLSNAIKFTANGSVQLTIAANVLADRECSLEIAVRDTGIGIPPDKLGLIFEPFTQADGSTTRKFGGTGLGLSISKKLVERMGGTCRVLSEVGKGTVFLFTVKLTMDAGAAAAETPDDRAPAGNGAGRILNILVAEDNAVNQLVIRRLLEKRGWSVAIVDNGRAAVEAWQDGRFDIILMDVQMPELDGLGATRIIRDLEAGRATRVPIIALTAHAMKGDREMCIQAGMDGHLTKPVQPANVYKLVSELTAHRASSAS